MSAIRPNVPSDPALDAPSGDFATLPFPNELPPENTPKASKAAIRQSLHASTADGVFAALFSNVTGGVLLSSFFLELGAHSTDLGLLAAAPMLANLLQPLGAYISELVPSRHLYCLWIYGLSRLLWIFLALGIGWTTWQQTDLHWLLLGTMVITLLSHLLGALGSAAWLSWMAVLVPRRLRGRYFGFRNSAANLTTLISVPLISLAISHWFGGSIQGYGIVLGAGVIAGFVSLAFQGLMVDVNPQIQQTLSSAPNQPTGGAATDSTQSSASGSIRSSLIAFLVYFTLWTFAVNLSAPFFNLYLLDSLKLDISQVTLYNSLSAAANLILLVFWGRLADRLGNRSILLSVGILVAATPLLWLGTGATSWSIWLWFPLLHLLSGGTWAAIELCSNNLQIGIAPIQGQSSYFGLVAAMTGISGALGTITGGFLAQMEISGGIFGVFALSSGLRLVSLLPLLFVHEQHGQPLSQLMQLLSAQIEQSEQPS